MLRSGAISGSLPVPNHSFSDFSWAPSVYAQRKYSYHMTDGDFSLPECSIKRRLGSTSNWEVGEVLGGRNSIEVLLSWQL